jgi:hypothetical protein
VVWPFDQFVSFLSPQPRIGVPIMDGADGNNGCHCGGGSLDSKMVAPLTQRFGEVISTEEDLRKIVGPPNRWFTSAILNKLDRRCQDFIAASPFIVVGSTDASGLLDLSPKGDRAGFVRCLDDAPLPFRIVAATAALIPFTTCFKVPASAHQIAHRRVAILYHTATLSSLAVGACGRDNIALKADVR